MKMLLPIRQQLKVFILIVLFGMSCVLLHAQNPLVKQWDERYGGTSGEFPFSIQQTTDYGFILGGHSNSSVSGDKSQPAWNGNSFDYWVIKIDPSGNKEWDKRFGGLWEEDFAALKQTRDGGYILGGYSNSLIGGDKTQDRWGDVDYWVVKIDSVGNKQWDKRFGGTKHDELSSLDTTFDGGYILGGTSDSEINGDKTEPTWGLSSDYWVVKIDSVGNKQWDKRFGGNVYEELLSIQSTTDGGYMLGGYSGSAINGDKTDTGKGGYDYWIVKIDSLGNKQWDKDFGGSGADKLCSLQQTSDGGYILGGRSTSPVSGDKTQPTWGYDDYWMVKIDSSGNKQWDKDFGGSYTEAQFHKILQTKDGGYLLDGNSGSPISGDKTENNLSAGPQIWMVKTDAMGVKQWDKTVFSLGWDGYGNALQANDGCYMAVIGCGAGIGGYKTQPAWGGTSANDYWVVKFCDTTLSLPKSGLMCTDTIFCEKHCIDFYDLSTNNPTSWQWFLPGADSTSSFLQNPMNICYNNYGSFDVTLIVCNAAGCDTLLLPGFINEYQTLTPTITQSNDTLFSSPGVAYQWWSVDSGIITGANSSYYIPTQPSSYYVIVTDTNGCDGASNTIIITGINQLSIIHYQLSIIPNPNDGSFTVSINDIIRKDFSVRIINAMGQTIQIENGWRGRQPRTALSIDINMSNVAAGLYAVEVINGNKVYRGRFVKE